MITNKEFQEKVDAIEKGTYKYDFEIAEAFRSIAPEEELTDEQRDISHAEQILFRFRTEADLGYDGPRFKPMVEYTNGKSFPNESLLTAERLAYYYERSKVVKYAMMRARYLDISLIYNQSIDKTKVAADTVKAYIEASEIDGLGSGIDEIDCVYRAYFIAKKYKGQNPASYRNARNNVISSIQRYQADNIRWTNELIELVIKFSSDFTVQQLKTAKDAAKSGLDYYSKGENYNLRESFLDLFHQMDKLISPSEFDEKKAAREDAQVYLEEAERRTDSLFVKQLHLLKAEKILRDAKLNREANQIHKQVEALGKAPEYLDEMHHVSYQQRISREEIDKLANALLSSSDKAAYLALSANFKPSWTGARRLASEDKNNYISDQLFGSITVNEDGMPIAVDKNKPEIRKVMRYYDSYVSTTQAMIELSFMPLVKEGKFTQADIDPHLDKLKLLNENTYESVRIGFDYFFKKKYYEALLILVPQLEDMLGDLVVKFGLSRYRQSEESLVEFKTLGPILGDLKKIIGDNHYHYLHYMFIDPAKVNLRNKVGHGKLKITDEHLEYKVCVVLIAYLSILVPITPSQADENEE